MKDNLIKILKLLGWFPENGFGELILKFESNKIVNAKLTKSFDVKAIS